MSDKQSYNGPVLECCRDAVGPERRHLRIMGATKPLCGTVTRQDGAGGGKFSELLRWPTCSKCHAIAQHGGASSSQADDTPITVSIAKALSDHGQQST